MNFTIRRYRNDDLDPILALSLLAWAPIFQSFEQVLGSKIFKLIYPDWETSQKSGVGGYIQDTENHITWVAEVNGAVVGFVAYEFNLEEKTSEVELLAVHPDYQNQEIGTDLNRHVLKKMRESGIKLAVVGTGGDPAHAPARRCYEKAGFTGLPLVRYYQDLSEG